VPLTPDAVQHWLRVWHSG